MRSYGCFRALALVHHLAIANNVPLALIAEWLQPMGEHLIIEFVPKSDEKVKLLLQNRKDIFNGYSLENFNLAKAQNVLGAGSVFTDQRYVGSFASPDSATAPVNKTKYYTRNSVHPG